jgi:hypothetical protein
VVEGGKNLLPPEGGRQDEVIQGWDMGILGTEGGKRCHEGGGKEVRGEGGGGVEKNECMLMMIE